MRICEVIAPGDAGEMRADSALSLSGVASDVGETTAAGVCVGLGTRVRTRVGFGVGSCAGLAWAAKFCASKPSASIAIKNRTRIRFMSSPVDYNSTANIGENARRVFASKFNPRKM